MEPGPHRKLNQYHSIKAALFDIDNTLVANLSPNTPTERFKIATSNARGIISVGIASARPLAKVSHILDYLDVKGYSILCNGAQIINSADHAVAWEKSIDSGTCNELIRYIEELDVDYWVNDNGIDYFVSKKDGKSFEKQSDIWDVQSERMVVAGFQLHKPFVLVLHNINATTVERVQGFVQRHHDKTITSLIAHQSLQPDKTFLYDLFIVHKQANKKDALHEIARLNNITVSEIMAVGDGRNDAEMIAEAGIGVAMGNSARETLDVATYIAPDWDRDGAAIALEFATKNLTKS